MGRRNALVGLAAMLCAGCAGFLAEPYQTPPVKMPEAWMGTAPGAGGTPWPDSAWWQEFQSPELDRLVTLAMAENSDLNAAAARVEQSRARSRIASAGLYPTVTVPGTVAVSDRVGESRQDFYDISVRAGYELDLWGRNQFAAESGEQALMSSIYDQETVRIALMADVASGYFLLLSIRDRLRTAEQSRASAQRFLNLIEAQYEAGKISALELERQLTVVAATEAAIPPLRQQHQAALDALAVLLGRTPDQVLIEGQTLRTLPLPPVSPGLPSELLERRPDIRRAEAGLRAANADIGEARAAMFPSVTLGAAGGYQSDTLSRLFRSGTGFYSIGLDMLATIFDGGRLSGQRDLTIARKKELVENYRKAVLVSFQDVEDALAGVEHFQEQSRLLQQAAVHAREAYRLAEMRYFYGAEDLTTVLDAQRAYLVAEQALDPARFAWASSLVALYRALGGGWSDPDGQPASAGAEG